MNHYDLLASNWTTAGDAAPTRGDETSPWSLRQRVEAAADAGWRGFGILHADLVRARDEIGLTGISALLKDNGMEYVELEMLNDWYASGAPRTESDSVRRDLLDAAGPLSARHIKIGTGRDGTVWPVELMANELHALCEEAESAGTRIALEPMPFTQVNDVDAGLGLIDAAGHGAGGLIIDTWHVARAGTPFSRLRDIDVRYIFAVELDDADDNVPADLFTDTLDNRRLCGEGDIAVTDFIQAILSTGYSGPWGVEILSNDHRARSLRSQARLAYVTTMWHFYLAEERLGDSKIGMPTVPAVS